MKESEIDAGALKAFTQWREGREWPVLLHLKGCRQTGRSVPVRECTCDCYDRQLFMYGYLAGRQEEAALLNRGGPGLPHILRPQAS